MCSATKFLKVYMCLVHTWSRNMWIFKDVILVIKFEEAQWCWISIRVACIWKLKNCLFQEWVYWCLGYRRWECVYRDFGSAWKLRIHMEGLHEGINRCLLLTDFDGRMIQKISWDDKWTWIRCININKLCFLSKRMHFDLRFPIKLKNHPKNQKGLS